MFKREKYSSTLKCKMIATVVQPRAEVPITIERKTLKTIRATSFEGNECADNRTFLKVGVDSKRDTGFVPFAYLQNVSFPSGDCKTLFIRNDSKTAVHIAVLIEYV